jgi:hypothetical protein
MTEPLIELLNRITDTQVKMVNHLAFLEHKWQQIEAEKTPKYWKPTTINLQFLTCTQLLPYNELRDSFAILNAGPSAVLLSDNIFNPNDALAQLGTPSAPGNAATAPLRLWYLAANASSSTISTRGPLWAYSANAATGTNINAYLTILETTYGARIVGHSQVVMEGEASRLMSGHDITNAVDPKPLL